MIFNNKAKCLKTEPETLQKLDVMVVNLVRFYMKHKNVHNANKQPLLQIPKELARGHHGYQLLLDLSLLWDLPIYLS